MKKIKTLHVLIAVLISLFGFSQEQKTSPEMQAQIETEINETVWKPFKKAWESRDWKTFNDLHTDDVLRVSKWGIKVGDTYKNGVEERYKKNADSPITKTIDFWLEHRIYQGDVGYEVGYYKVVNNRPDEDPQEFYARFHIVLRKVDGAWKIAQDWDTSEINGVKVTAEDFAKGVMLDL